MIQNNQSGVINESRCLPIVGKIPLNIIDYIPNYNNIRFDYHFHLMIKYGLWDLWNTLIYGFSIYSRLVAIISRFIAIISISP